MVKMNIHGRMGAGMCKIFGATLAVMSAAVESTPANFDRESFVFIIISICCTARFILHLRNIHVAVLNQSERNQQHINCLDANERHEQTAKSIDQQVIP